MSTAAGFRPFPLVLAAPSGTGKTTIARTLVSRHSDLVFSVSVATRPPRPKERQGTDYDFISRQAFQQMIDRDELAEWAEVHGNLYGTPTKPLEDSAGAGKCPVLDIDVQGARQIRASFPRAVLVFVLPPTAEDLWTRLTARGTEGLREVGARLQTAREELDEAASFDYVVINDDLNQAVTRVRTIVEAESHSVSRQPGLGSEVTRIRREVDEMLVQEGAQGPIEG